MTGRVVLAGLSTRAAAASAARAGFGVVAIDAFADRDQAAGVDAHAVQGRFDPHAAAALAAAFDAEAAAYLSNFENDPAAVAKLASGRELWGNGPDVLAQVRDPRLLAQALARRELPAPRLGGSGGTSWLSKPIASGGGRGIRPWRPGQPVAAGHYVQEFLQGAPASIVFVGNGRESVVLGTSRQLAGLPAFGASAFQYCGNVIDPALERSSDWREAAARLAQVLTEEFRLVGVNGVDVIVQNGRPHAIEVNPRWSASMELIDTMSDPPVFSIHAAACARGGLPAAKDAWRRREAARGKAIVYARKDAVIPDARAWLSGGDVGDIPREGVRIRSGQPVCTVFAGGPDVESCVAALERRAAAIYADLAAWAGEGTP